MALSEADRFQLNRMNNTARATRLGDKINIQAYNSSASTGGAATETLTVTGLGATDEILAVTTVTAGALAASLRAIGAQAANSLQVTFTANPGAGAVVRVLVLKAVPAAL